jgi:hypothetical protein
MPLAIMPRLTGARCGGQMGRPLRRRRFDFRHGIEAKFLAHVCEFRGIGKTPVAHHSAQFGHPGLGKEQPWQALAGIKPHQPPFQEALGSRRQFRLASLRTAAPGLEEKAVGNRGIGGEEHIEFAPDIVPLAG